MFRAEWLAASPAALLLLAAARAAAAPQANAGLTVGGAATDLRTTGPHGALHLGMRADVLFLRSRDREMALGPYVDFVTEGFDSAELGAGVEWLLPVWSAVPFVFSAGTLARRAAGVAWAPGVASTVFVGSRSYNFDSFYALAAGFFVQGRYGFGAARQTDVIAGLQVDLSLLGYPFLFAYQAMSR